MSMSLRAERGKSGKVSKNRCIGKDYTCSGISENIYYEVVKCYRQIGCKRRNKYKHTVITREPLKRWWQVSALSQHFQIQIQKSQSDHEVGTKKGSGGEGGWAGPPKTGPCSLGSSGTPEAPGSLPVPPLHPTPTR